MNKKENFEKFTTELAKLSKKYGVAIHSTGGVMIGKIRSVHYHPDHTSGDLDLIVQWKVEKGDTVVIPIDLKKDPYNRRGQKSEVLEVDNQIVKVQFSNGSIGYYYEDVFSD
jgi:hypothetical protein